MSAKRGSSLFIAGATSFPPGPQARRQDIRIIDGVIAEIGDRLVPRSEEILQAHGLTAIPGLVDVHVHFRDPGLEHIEGWERGSAGALHGGVTSVVEVQNNPPLSTSLAALRARIEHVRARSRVDFGCLANLLPESLGELQAMASWTPAFKLFLGGSTGLGGQVDASTIRALFQGAARAGRMIVAHCEDEGRLAEGRARYPSATAAEHHLVRSSAAEVESIELAIALAMETGASLHVFHVSTAEGAEAIERARASRARGSTEVPGIFASTAPHYLLLSCEDAGRLENRLKVNPSVKTPRDRDALIRAVASGAIDAIGTDHAPHPQEKKRLPYAQAPSGMPSVDLLWPLTFELVRTGKLDAERALASVTSTAAQSLRLPRKGSLAKGFDGDVVLFDPAEERVVEGASLPSRSKWSAYEGMKLAGFPRFVARRGEICLREGEVCADGGGMPLELEPPRAVESR